MPSSITSEMSGINIFWEKVILTSPYLVISAIFITGAFVPGIAVYFFLWLPRSKSMAGSGG